MKCPKFVPVKFLAFIILLLLTSVWVLSVASCVVPRWSTLGMADLGLWSICLNSKCISTAKLSMPATCGRLLRATQAFSIIFLGFAASVPYGFAIFCIPTARGPCISGFLLTLAAGAFSVLPWSIYLGFTLNKSCANSGSLGAGWILALVACCLCGAAALLSLLHTICVCCQLRRLSKKAKDIESGTVATTTAAPDGTRVPQLPSQSMPGMKPDPLLDGPSPLWMPTEFRLPAPGPGPVTSPVFETRV